MKVDLLYTNDAGHFGDLVLEISLDSHGQRYFTGRATHAGAVQPNLNESFVVEVDELDVAPITLCEWP